MILRHGTTRVRGERMLQHGPDPPFRETGGEAWEDGFSMNVEAGPFLFRWPEDDARGKARQFPDEGGPVILAVDVPDDIVQRAANDGFPLYQGPVPFDPGAGLEGLIAAWPVLSKEIRDVTGIIRLSPRSDCKRRSSRPDAVSSAWSMTCWGCAANRGFSSIGGMAGIAFVRWDRGHENRRRSRCRSRSSGRYWPGRQPCATSGFPTRSSLMAVKANSGSAPTRPRSFVWRSPTLPASRGWTSGAWRSTQTGRRMTRLPEGLGRAAGPTDGRDPRRGTGATGRDCDGPQRARDVRLRRLAHHSAKDRPIRPRLPG